MPTSTRSWPICARCRRRSDAGRFAESFFSFADLAHGIVDVDRREIVGVSVAAGACVRHIDAARQHGRALEIESCGAAAEAARAAIASVSLGERSLR